MMTWLRRAFWLSLLGGGAIAAWRWWQRDRTSTPADVPEWPPLTPTGASPATSTGRATASGDSAAGETAPTTDGPEAGSGDGEAASIAAAVAETASAHDTPEAPDTAGAPGATVGERAAPVEGRWRYPIDGECPEGYPVKANDNSGIFHAPGGRFYNRTVPERCYSSAEVATEDGYRPAKA